MKNKNLLPELKLFRGQVNGNLEYISIKGIDFERTIKAAIQGFKRRAFKKWGRFNLTDLQVQLKNKSWSRVSFK